MSTQTEQTLDEKYGEILVEAYERGVIQGTHDKMSGYHNPTPLSGEWAGESPNEILGDLFHKATKLVGEEDEGIYQDVCDNYETGYHDGNTE